MLDRFKDAARRARADRAIGAVLARHGAAEGASVQFRDAGEGRLRATVLLSESPSLAPDAHGALESALQGIEGLTAVTLVATRHNAAPPPPPAAPKGGHDNPLHLPGTRREGPPEKTRPGGAQRIVAVASGKGGVGKSTVAAHLALALARRGERVGLLDLDIYGPSLLALFSLEETRPEVREGKVVPLRAMDLSLMSIGFLVAEEKAVAWRGPMVMGAAKQLIADTAWGEIDTLVVDTPPGTGDAHLTLLQRMEVDGAIIVSTPSPLALADVRRGAALFGTMKVPILGLVENMATLADGSRPFGPPLDAHALVSTTLASLPLDAAFSPPLGAAPGTVARDAFDALAERLAEALPLVDRAGDAQ